ncbi:hypothetical protein AC578_2031 [Pseudocercospora eumusae]|uniref:Uncharacterized protein n=1 Tax=Pseudocercospora eumusae TaxID=321146 RepID=A0A139HH11_9PEZI|nr:hypothetical protein AC578_2031 [Pseudocercospora eumusae]
MTGIDTHAAGTADSLGAYLRKGLADEESLQTAEGQAWDTEICIGAQWASLTFLALTQQQATLLDCPIT